MFVPQTVFGSTAEDSLARDSGFRATGCIKMEHVQRLKNYLGIAVVLPWQAAFDVTYPILVAR